MLEIVITNPAIIMAIGTCIVIVLAARRVLPRSEIPSEGLKLLETRQSEEALKLERLYQAIEVGLADERNGQTVRIAPGESAAVLARLGRTGAKD